MKNTELDIEEISKNTHRLLWVLIFFIVSFIIWAAFSPIDVVSSARGSVIPSSKVQKIQHLEGGIVQSIEVKEGQMVKEGDELIILSAINNKSEVDELRVRTLSLKAEIARLEAESLGKEKIEFSKEFQEANNDLVKSTYELFKARINSINSKRYTQKKNIEEITARLRNLHKKLKLAQEQVSIGEELLKQDLSNRYEQIDRLQQVESLKSQIDEDKVAIKKANEELNQINTNYKEEIQSELTQNRQNLNEFEKRLERFEDSLSRTVIKAPLSGTVKQLNFVTIGGVVKAGDIVMEIVPYDDKLIVEAKLLPMEMGHIRPNQRAFVQLEGSDSYRYGKVEGVVIHISPDSLVTSEGEAYFIVRIALDRDYFGTPNEEKIKLFPGMIVTTGIVLGKRSVLEYILSPFMDGMSFIFTEK